ncbi:hypothetical protein EYF80_037341 [Liparis tanakae]|uniref:Uncharacterized protein n=1 Tax=Liparis tanakae TaxID=230148 RepID=A0A4Z2GGT8_9TELE|nr:hypothetical protein EYF80_037341 [Liparis tanakae]
MKASLGLHGMGNQKAFLSPSSQHRGAVILLFGSSPFWAFSSVSLEGGLVTPGILGRPRGGVLATGELRHPSRNFRS